MKRSFGWTGFACAVMFGLAACSQTSDAPKALDSDASTQADAATFGQGACAACWQANCSQPFTACQADPGCATWLQCVYDCPSGDAGAPAADCQAQCPEGQGSATAQAIGNARDCTTMGPGASCLACGGPTDAGAAESGADNPILHQKCQPSQETKPCWKCEDERCCDTYAACHNRADCVAFVECVQKAATYDEGMKACQAQYPNATELFLRRVACVNVLCAVECGIETNPCLECQRLKCASVYVDCSSVPECDAIKRCVAACTDSACMTACQSAHPSATTAYQALAVCYVGNCASQCP